VRREIRRSREADADEKSAADPADPVEKQKAVGWRQLFEAAGIEDSAARRVANEEHACGGTSGDASSRSVR
jgi:hypothetical protein